MNLVLARIDDRLVHGQVTVGWRNRLRPDHIVLANDDIADDPWQARIYAMSVPPEVEFLALSVGDAARLLQEGQRNPLTGSRVLLLTGSALDMQRLVASGAPVLRVNVGGMHYARGKREMLPEVYVDRFDLAALRALRERGVELWVQMVPGGHEDYLEAPHLRAMEEGL